MKTPGQKAFEAACTIMNACNNPVPSKWESLSRTWQIEWEAVAAAVTAPEPKSYGEVLHEAYKLCADNLRPPFEVLAWPDVGDVCQRATEAGAAAVIAEYRKREGL